MPKSWMSAGIRSTPSRWCRIPSPGRSGSSIRMRPIASYKVKGNLSGRGFPKLMVRLPCGSPSISSTFFPACASPMPKLAQVVVLPTPPFWLAMAMICVFNDFTSFLIFLWLLEIEKAATSKTESDGLFLSRNEIPRKRKKRPVKNTERLAIRLILFWSN